MDNLYLHYCRYSKIHVDQKVFDIKLLCTFPRKNQSNLPPNECSFFWETCQGLYKVCNRNNISLDLVCLVGAERKQGV